MLYSNLLESSQAGSAGSTSYPNVARHASGRGAPFAGDAIVMPRGVYCRRQSITNFNHTCVWGKQTGRHADRKVEHANEKSSSAIGRRELSHLQVLCMRYIHILPPIQG